MRAGFAALVAAVFLAMPVAAQRMESESERSEAASAPGAVLRGLDKLSGVAQDLNLSVGETQPLGRLQVTLGDCRYPVNNPAGDAFAYLVVRDPQSEAAEPLFQGWMIASAPALNALEHPRYDLWVIRCTS
ncbi:MAG: DUF2155 domain-containing protein [Tranquillimonas sp.]